MVTLATSISEMLLMEEAAFGVEAIRTDSPLSRYFQFRAYVDLIRILENRGEMPSDFAVEIDLNDWIAGRAAPDFIKQRILALLYRLKENGANTLSELCDFYCE